MEEFLLDQSGNPYIESLIDIDKPEDGYLRVTFLKTGWPNCPTIRIQIRTEQGKLFPGPEIPLEIIGFITKAAFKLLNNEILNLSNQ